jgi:hypothetical protein
MKLYLKGQKKKILEMCCTFFLTTYSEMDKNFLQTNLEKISSDPFKIIPSVCKHLKRTLNS